MNKSHLDQIKKEILPILKKADVKKATLFGSYVRGDHTEKSDIDILVDLPAHATLIDLVGIKQDLEEKLKKNVDIVEYDGLDPLIKASILSNQYSIL